MRATEEIDGVNSRDAAARQEPVRARPGLVDVRPADRRDRRLDREEVRGQARRCATPTSPPSAPATTSARRRSCWRSTTRSSRRRREPGTYRNVNGTTAMALGLVAASVRSGLPLFYASYPITPASELLHELSRHTRFGVRTMQAEDEIAAVNIALGASFGGQLGVTATSGPGHGPEGGDDRPRGRARAAAGRDRRAARRARRRGCRRRPRQSDLLLAIYGRHGESPLPVIAASTPGQCFDAALEAVRIAVKYRTPVILLSDTFLANSSEPWRVPDVADLPADRPRLRDRAERRRASSCPTCATRTSRGPGRSRARPACSTASAASRRRTAPATSATSPTTTR